MKKPIRTPSQARIVRVVVASPGDVPGERKAVASVAEELNRDVAADRNLVLRVVRWETDAFPGFHAKGPQGIVDEVLRIAECDVLIGIFWKRFGTPTRGAKSGTEYEIRKAYASWKKRGAPDLMIYFNQKSHTPKTEAERNQWQSVQDFQTSFLKDALWWSYKGRNELTDLVRTHLTRWILRRPPSTTTKRKISASRRAVSEVKKVAAVRAAAPTPKSNSKVSSVRLSALEAQLAAYAEDHAAANKQLINALSEVERSRLRRKLQEFESEMVGIENKILKLKTR